MPKPKLDANAEIPERLMKLIGCSLGMEALLEEILVYFKSHSPYPSEIIFIQRIEAQLKRTGRLK